MTGRLLSQRVKDTHDVRRACSRLLPLLCLASLRSGSKESGDDVALGR